MAIPYVSYDDLRKVADKFQAEYNLPRNVPIPIDNIAEFGFGIDIFPIAGLQRNFDVVAFLSNNLKQISVDDYVFKHRENRYRFSIAHELSHVVLHSDLYNAEFKTVAEWKQFQQDISEKDYARAEWQANNLAGLILVPEKELKRAFNESLKRCADAEIDPYDDKGAGIEFISTSIGREVFNVSSEVVRYRIRDDALMELS